MAEVVKDLDKPASEQVLSLLANSRNYAVAEVSLVMFNALYENDKTIIRTLDIRNYKDAVRDLPDLNQAEFWVNLGNFNYELQNFEAAIQLYDLARNVFKNKGRWVEVAKIDVNQAGVYENLGKYEKALDLYNKAITVFEENGIIIDQNLADVYYDDIGKHEEALEWYYGPLNKTELQKILYKADWGSGKVKEKQNNLEEAYNSYKTAIEILENLRGDLKEESHRQSFFESKMGVYKSMVRVCLKLDKVNEAYEYVERSKSRVFIDLLATQQIFSGTVDPELLEREKELKFKLIALKSKLEGEDKGLVGSRGVFVRSVESEESLQRELAQTQAEYSEVLNKIKEQDPEYGSLKTVFTLPIEEIQEMVKNFEDCILLEYYVTDEKVIVFILDGEKVEFEEIEIASKKLYEMVSSFIKEISNPIIKPHIVKSASKAMYDLLFSIIEKYIKAKKLVYIVPHSILHYIPFSALYDGEEYLVQKSYTLALCPSGTVLHFCFEKEKGKKLETCLAVGNPSKDLKFAEEEVNYVASLFSSELLLTDLAIKEKVKNGVAKCNIFHFAGHGYFNKYNPVYSFLKLAGVDRITVGETFNLNLKMASLVNLSACESGLSEISEGDELIGLIRGFIFAGSPSVVASLWNVDDKSTGELMKDFYEKCKEGKNKAYALKSAKQSILNRYDHPHYWAAFELNGSYGGI